MSSGAKPEKTQINDTSFKRHCINIILARPIAYEFRKTQLRLTNKKALSKIKLPSSNFHMREKNQVTQKVLKYVMG